MNARWIVARARRGAALPITAAASVVAAIIVIVLASGPGGMVADSARHAVRAGSARDAARRQGATAPAGTIASHAPAVITASPGTAAGGRATGTAVRRRPRTGPAPARVAPASLARSVGQLIVAGFPGTTAPDSILATIRAGQVGGIILSGENTAGGVDATHQLVDHLQAAASRGGNPGLLIMTDQEGGKVKRLPGPPDFAAAAMANPALAGAQGAATARLLRAAGVNVDLAPVGDVTHIDGFMTQEQRTFGSDPGAVAHAACAFARGLAAGGVAYTLKHFPGLGDAGTNTDEGPVTVAAAASLLRRDEAPYRLCGSNRLALVMVSSASYPALTGTTPAALSPIIYGSELPADGVDAVTISDDFQAPAIADLDAPARRAIDAGLDLVMYAQTEAASADAYRDLVRDLHGGLLRAGRIEAAAQRVLSLKRALGLAGRASMRVAGRSR